MRFIKILLLFIFINMIQIIQMIIGFFIFCVILFLYLHIQFHLKTSNDLEVFEIDNQSKEVFEEICDFRQPIIFDNLAEQTQIVQYTNKEHLLKNFPAFEIKMRDIQNMDDDETEIYTPLTFQLANTLLEKDDKSIYFSENNNDFLQETGVTKTIQQNDQYLRPFLNSMCLYDVMIGSDKVTTPFRYNINYRNYFIVTQGSIKVKLTPPKSSRYLHPIYDYENFEFKSPINPWAPQSHYANDFDKVKCLEVTLVPGKCFYIPAYWWYSIQFTKDTSVTCLYYRTYMNTISITPQLILFFLQNQNVKRSIIKKKMEIIISEKNDNEANDNEVNDNKSNDNKSNDNEQK